MTSITSVLVATDFSDVGNNAARRAALLAREHGARLHILHVVKAAPCKPLRSWFCPTMDTDQRSAKARLALQRMAIEITNAYHVTPTVEALVGHRFDTLLRASDRADLIVLGQRSDGRLGGPLFSGTADRLLRSCRRPVLVVRTPAQQAYRRVLVPIDFTSSSDDAIRVATQVRRGALMQVFHAINMQRDAVLRDADVPEHVIRETRLMEEAGTNARMRRKVAELGLDCTPLSFALAYGPAVKSTLSQAQQLGADLIVAGKQRRSTVGGLFRGSVSSRVLSESACDMLVVPRPRDSSPVHAAATVAPSMQAKAHRDNATLARSAAAFAGALTQSRWSDKTVHLGQRGTS